MMFTRFNATRSLVSLTFLATTVACGIKSEHSSRISVTNGQQITESDYPSVVFLAMELPEGQGVCTGTFVSTSQLITAGHCVEGLDPAAPAMYLATQDAQGEFVAKVRALSFVRNPAYSFSQGVGHYDLSVVTFPEGSAPAVSRLAHQEVQVGDDLTIVGYGNNVNIATPEGGLEGSGAGLKRVGKNQVADLSEGMIMFAGVPESVPELKPGEYSVSGSGDSGGPLFIAGELAGVTSGGGFAELSDGQMVAVSMYVDLQSAESKSFLSSALKL